MIRSSIRPSAPASSGSTTIGASTAATMPSGCARRGSRFVRPTMRRGSPMPSGGAMRCRTIGSIRCAGPSDGRLSPIAGGPERALAAGSSVYTLSRSFFLRNDPLGRYFRAEYFITVSLYIMIISEIFGARNLDIRIFSSYICDNQLEKPLLWCVSAPMLAA